MTLAFFHQLWPKKYLEANYLKSCLDLSQLFASSKSEVDYKSPYRWPGWPISYSYFRKVSRLHRTSNQLVLGFRILSTSHRSLTDKVQEIENKMDLLLPDILKNKRNLSFNKLWIWRKIKRFCEGWAWVNFNFHVLVLSIFLNSVCSQNFTYSRRRQLVQ